MIRWRVCLPAAVVSRGSRVPRASCARGLMLIQMLKGSVRPIVTQNVVSVKAMMTVKKTNAVLHQKIVWHRVIARHVLSVPATANPIRNRQSNE